MTHADFIHALKDSGLEIYGLGKDRDKFLAACKGFVDTLTAAKERDLDTLYRLYEQACEQRDTLMDQQRVQAAKLRRQVR